MQGSSLPAAAIGVALLIGMAGSALADTKDYEFQLLDKEVKQGAAVISVKLVHKPSAAPSPTPSSSPSASTWAPKAWR